MTFDEAAAKAGQDLELEGAFTFKDYHVFRSLLNILRTRGGKTHVIDLSRVEFLDSAALGMLLIAEDEAKRGGWTITLRRPTAQIAKILELAAMDSLFVIEV